MEGECCLLVLNLVSSTLSRQEVGRKLCGTSVCIATSFCQHPRMLECSNVNASACTLCLRGAPLRQTLFFTFFPLFSPSFHTILSQYLFPPRTIVRGCVVVRLG